MLEASIAAVIAVVFFAIGYFIAYHRLRRKANGSIQYANEEGDDPYLFLGLSEPVDIFTSRKFVILEVEKVKILEAKKVKSR